MHTSALNAHATPNRLHWFTAAVLLLSTALAIAVLGGVMLEGLRRALFAFFGAAAVWRGLALGLARPTPEPSPLWEAELPAYTVICPLLHEGEMIPSLLAALDRIDYPRHLLQVVLALEWDDRETRAAVENAVLPGHVEPLIVPPGAPRTKPRACNAALAVARGDRVVVYDAEDRPDPGQLREAAARFANGRERLACLQAPLRVPLKGSLTMRQFSLEYAALFELLLPALARLGAPFPLGGTSNHFRTDALRAVGGWDAWNVTEDADLGFRLTAAGYELGVLNRPTLEDAPQGAREWMPQRSRWLKGYMQTWWVYMSRPWSGSLVWLLSLQLTVGLSVLSALLYAPAAIIVAVQVVLSATPFGGGPQLPDALLFIAGWAMAALCMSSGAQRAGERARLTDALLAPAYWSLLSLAFCRALHQLARRPHHWDKTPHHPPADVGLPLDDVSAEPVVEAA